MRTTLTLDEDVAALLRQRARETGRPFKQVVNEALRAGLIPRPTLGADVVPSPTFPLGVRPGLDVVHARHLAAELEDEETLRRLDLRK
jgi:hypothetical protein